MNPPARRPVVIELPDQTTAALRRVAARQGLDVNEYVNRVLADAVAAESDGS